MNAEEELRPGFLRGKFEGEDAEPPVGGFERLMDDLGRQPGRTRRPLLWLWVPALLLVTGAGTWMAMDADTGADRPVPAATRAESAARPLAQTPANASSLAPAATGSGPARQADSRPQQAQSPAISNNSQPASQLEASSADAPAAGAETAAPGDARQPETRTVRRSASGSLSQAAVVAPEQEAAPEPVRETSRSAARARRSRPAIGMVAAATIGRRPARRPAATETRTHNAGSDQAIARAETPARPVAEPAPNTAAEPAARPAADNAAPEAATANTDAQTQPSAGIAAGVPAADVRPDSAPAESQKPAIAAKPDSAPAGLNPITEKKTVRHWERGVYAGLLIRRRDAVMVRAQEGDRINWSASQRRQIPGLEAGASLGYRLGQNLTLGASLGMGIWKEHLDVRSQFEKPQPAVTFNLATDAYDVNPQYTEVQSGSISWMAMQAHSTLWLRLGNRAMPFSAQAGPSLDAVRAFNGKTSGPSNLAGALLPAEKTRFVPGIEAKFRFKPYPTSPGGWVYEISGRNHFKPAFDNAGLFKLQYGMVTFGASFIW